MSSKQQSESRIQKSASDQDRSNTAHIVLSQRFDPEIGGSIAWLKEIYQHWPEQVEIVTHDYAETNPKESDLSNVKVHRYDLQLDNWGLDSFSRIKKYYRSYKSVANLIKDYDSCVIHCAKIIPEALSVIVLKVFNPKLKIISYVHGEELKAYQSSMQLRIFLRIATKFINLFIVNSSNTKKLLHRSVSGLKEDRVFISNPCINTKQFQTATRDTTRQKLNISSDSFVILTVARLVKRKNQISVVRAIAELNKENLLYFIVGDGPELEILQQEIQKYSLESRVKFFNNISDQEKVELYNASDLYVMTSIVDNEDLEGFGISYIEAQACGLPVVAGQSGGEKDALIEGKTGFLVDGRDLEQIKDAIQAFYNNPDLYKKFSKDALVNSVNYDSQVASNKIYEKIGYA